MSGSISIRGGGEYAFDSNKTNLLKCLPQMGNVNFVDPTHSKEIDIMGLKLAQDIPGVKLYCLTEGSVLANYVPLAPAVNENPMRPQDKAPDALKDFADLPATRAKFGPVRRFVEKHNLWAEYEKLKGNIYIRALYDLIDLVKMVPRVLKKLYFPPRKNPAPLKGLKQKTENL